MPISETTFRKVALEDPEGHWELWCGRLQRKPGMTAEHEELGFELAFELRAQLDRSQFRVRSDAGRVRRSAENYFIPDVLVLPTAAARAQFRTGQLAFYSDPVPLVVEVWSPSTGAYDVNVKLSEYQRRGDLEIWLMHPIERSLRTWVRHPDGSYQERRFTGGVVQPTALPGVSIDLSALFARLDQ